VFLFFLGNHVKIMAACSGLACGIKPEASAFAKGIDLGVFGRPQYDTTVTRDAPAQDTGCSRYQFWAVPQRQMANYLGAARSQEDALNQCMGNAKCGGVVSSWFETEGRKYWQLREGPDASAQGANSMMTALMKRCVAGKDGALEYAAIPDGNFADPINLPGERRSLTAEQAKAKAEQEAAERAAAMERDAMDALFTRVQDQGAAILTLAETQRLHQFIQDNWGKIVVDRDRRGVAESIRDYKKKLEAEAQRMATLDAERKLTEMRLQAIAAEKAKQDALYSAELTRQEQAAKARLDALEKEKANLLLADQAKEKQTQMIKIGGAVAVMVLLIVLNRR
jgi:hypothetical protein